MPGCIRGIGGIIAFAGARFGGCYLAGRTQRKREPPIAAGALKIAVTRTRLGMLAGPPVTMRLAYAMAHFPPQVNSHLQIFGSLYAFRYALPVLVPALVICLFTRQIGLPEARLRSYAAFRAVCSSLLDLPGLGMAVISPGQIAIG